MYLLAFHIIYLYNNCFILFSRISTSYIQALLKHGADADDGGDKASCNPVKNHQYKSLSLSLPPSLSLSFVFLIADPAHQSLWYIFGMLQYVLEWHIFECPRGYIFGIMVPGFAFLIRVANNSASLNVQSSKHWSHVSPCHVAYPSNWFWFFLYTCLCFTMFTPLPSFRNGIWIWIGFGKLSMPGLDTSLCGIWRRSCRGGSNLHGDRTGQIAHFFSRFFISFHIFIWYHWYMLISFDCEIYLHWTQS